MYAEMLRQRCFRVWHVERVIAYIAEHEVPTVRVHGIPLPLPVIPS